MRFMFLSPPHKVYSSPSLCLSSANSAAPFCGVRVFEGCFSTLSGIDDYFIVQDLKLSIKNIFILHESQGRSSDERT